MNVAFLNDISILGGGEIWVLNMARSLTRRGHSVSIVCPHRSEFFYAAIDAGLDVYALDLTPGSPFHGPLYEYFRRREIDLVYCTVLGRFCEPTLLEPIVKRLPGARIILKTGLPPNPLLSPEYYGFGAGPLVRGLHVVSEENRQRFLELVPGSEDFVSTVREGVDLSRFKRNGVTREQARAQWHVADSENLLVSTSRLHPNKGHDNLLLAAHELVRGGRDVRLIFAGSGNEQSRLEALRDHLGLADRVQFAGRLDDVRSLLNAADVFCHPSLADGMPNSVAEAMAMGLPVIASRVGGVPEFVHHDETGLLVEPHDVRGLERGIKRLLDDPTLRGSLGQRAAAFVRDFDFEAQVDRWIAACQGPGTTPPPVPRAKTSYPVLFLMTNMRTGGEETELAILAKYLNRSRFPLSVASAYAVSEPSPAAAKIQNLGIAIDTACHGLREQDKAAYVVDKIRRERIRIVVACQNTALAYEVFGRLDPGECRLIEHAGYAPEVSLIPKDRTAALVGVSEGITREALPLFDAPGKVRCLPSMVDTGEYAGVDRDQLRRLYGFKGFIALFVGRIDAKKGIDHLVKAAAVLLPEFPELRFVVVGPPDGFQADYASRLINLAYDAFGKDRFTFAGPRDDVAGIMAAADAFLLPARGEGMSHVISEAGAAGLPVIAFEDGAAREQLEDGNAGILVPVDDDAGLADALRRLITDPAARASLGGALRAKVEREYSAQVVIPRWHSLFEEVGAGLDPVSVAPALRIIPEDRLMPFPAEIQVETNTACNATCIMCPYPEVSKELPPGRMDLELYEKILGECSTEKSLWRIEPFLNNEPFTDTRMVDWIALSKKRVPHAMVTVTTNGSLLPPKVTDRLVKSGLDAIWFSFNGATKETYEHIMGLSWDLVKRNIDYLLDHKPESLRVFTNMIETEPMRGEIAENIRYWQSRGVQSGSSPLVNRAGNVGNFVELNYKKHAANPVRLCELLYHKMYIGYNGDVLLCCMDWRRRVVLGNVRNQTLREVWQGEKYQHYRRQHELGRSKELELCDSCSYVYA